jgi:hypothetical protein
MLTEILFASVSSAWLGAAELETRTLVGGGLIILAALLAVIAAIGIVALFRMTDPAMLH